MPKHGKTFTDKQIIHQDTLRGGAEVARRAHNPKVVGSNPAPATNKRLSESDGLFCFGMAIGDD